MKHSIALCLLIPSVLAAQDDVPEANGFSVPPPLATSADNPASPAPYPFIPGRLPGEPAPAPPPPALPEPRLEVPPDHTIASRVLDLGDHTVTIERVRPVELPAPPPPAVNSATDPQQLAALRAKLAARPARKMLMLSATVYDHRATRLQGSGKDGRQIEAWSNIDFDLLRGLGALRRGEDEFYFLYLGIGAIDTARLGERMAAAGRIYRPPVVPPLPASAESQPAFVVTMGDPGPEDLAGIDALHELYRLEHQRLKVAREYARLAAERLAADRLLNPPKPPDIIIKSWRLSGQASVPGWKGGAR